MKIKRNFMVLGAICFLSILSSNINAAQPSEDYSSDNWIICDYWKAKFDGAGFGDEFYWWNSPYHPYSSHELLSGEWGAAIYYDGIDTDPNAMWLTGNFIFPSWSTNSDFSTTLSFNHCDNVNNPVNGYDTGQSKIANDEVEITIDYEVVDLGEYDWSSLFFTDANGVDYVRSEQYVILQTYMLKNIHATEDINNLEFYQMLHGHGTIFVAI